MSNTVVTEFDLRAPEFKQSGAKPEDFEFRVDGTIVRKDRWETGIRDIANVFNMGRSFEIDDLVSRIEMLNNIEPDYILQILKRVLRECSAFTLDDASLTDDLNDAVALFTPDQPETPHIPDQTSSIVKFG
jgi:hypothetical protein